MVQSKSAEALGFAIAKRLHAQEKTSAAWGLEFLDAGEGWARCSMIIREDMLNGLGIVHGGMLFALADTVFAWACNSHNTKAVAQQASISFLSPAELGEKLVAEARKDGAQGRAGVYTVRVIGGGGREVAVFHGLSRRVSEQHFAQEDIENDGSVHL